MRYLICQYRTSLVNNSNNNYKTRHYKTQAVQMLILFIVEQKHNVKIIFIEYIFHLVNGSGLSQVNISKNLMS
jgi:hypothetical protein